MAHYYTQLGNDGRGYGFNRTYTDAISYLHDIFLRASEEKLDVFMACSLLTEELRDTKYHEVVKRTFADSVRDVLKKNRDVHLFVWGDPSDSEISPSLKALMREARDRPQGWGRFSVIASGQKGEPDDSLHFVVAKSRDDSRWITRIEKWHSTPTRDQIKAGTFEVPALIMFDSEEAKVPGEKLVRGFANFSGEQNGIGNDLKPPPRSDSSEALIR